MPLDPLMFLGLICGVTVAAWIAGRLRRTRLRAELRTLARQWHMHYVERDVFALGRRVAGSLPAGASSRIVARDLIYGRSGEGQLYLCTVEYDQPADRLRKWRRVRRVAAVREPREGGPDGPVTISLSDPMAPLLAQYQSAHAFP